MTGVRWVLAIVLFVVVVVLEYVADFVEMLRDIFRFCVRNARRILFGRGPSSAPKKSA